MGYDADVKKKQIDEILTRAVGDSEWCDSLATEWAKTAQTEVFDILKQDGYKICVLAEAVAQGSGCVKVHYCLMSDDDLQVHTQIQNPHGVTMYCLAIATKYY